VTGRPGLARRLRRKLTYQRLIPLLGLLAGFPAVALSLVLLWTGDFTPGTRWTLGAVVVLAWGGCLFALRERLIRPLHAVSNMLQALREGDYSLRTRAADRDDALGLILHELNELTETFHDRRLDALEASNLLTRVLAVIDVALFAFDDDDRLRLLNRAGESLLGRPQVELVGRTAEELGLAACLSGGTPRVMNFAVARGFGRWELRRRTFRWDGRPHRLIVLADLSQVLREEERIAWQRLIRVLSHEINNSLTPIKSIAESLSAMLDRPEPLPDDAQDLRDGLRVIGGRSEALRRFMSSYARLAKLPAPARSDLPVHDWVRRVAALEPRVPVDIVPGPDLTIYADGDQLDQLLINLVENAADAAIETGGGVRLRWSESRGFLELEVEDDGPGLAQTANLFVPFFTTKPTGSGIGLALGRQIAEAHGGSLVLENRADASGCLARVRLPTGAVSAASAR
jgi:nitrogen fixation/metabolism regulation signal transduction histidine kinase